MRICAAVLALLVSSVFPSGASAQALTLSQCLQRASQKSVQAIQAIIAERRAKAATRESHAQRLPQFFFSGQLLRSDDAQTNLPDDNNGTFAVEQRLFPFNSGWVRGRQEDALYQAAILAKVESGQDVELTVKRLYFSILQGQDAERSIAEVDSELRRLLETVVPKYTVGRAPAFDPVKVRVALADLARDRGGLEARLAEERETLALIVGLPDGAQLELVPLSTFPSLPGPDFVAQALSANATLKTQGKKVEAARLGIKAAEYLRLPDLVGHLDYNYAGYYTNGMTAGWTAAVGMQFPVFDWGVISAKVAQERASLEQQKTQLEADRQKVLDSLTGALGQAKAHETNRRNYLELLPHVHEVAVAGVTRYRRGAMGILEATDGVSLWLNTLLQERAAYYGYLSDLARLERLSGDSLKVDYER